eukprot:jgi/Botrbrau1/15149/Bobra.0149s0018.1
MTATPRNRCCKKILFGIWDPVSVVGQRPLDLVFDSPLLGTTDEARVQKKKVLVFCGSGRSKAPAVVIMYLLRRHIALSDALGILKEYPGVIEITPGTMPFVVLAFLY